MEFIEAKLQNK